MLQWIKSSYKSHGPSRSIIWATGTIAIVGASALVGSLLPNAFRWIYQLFGYDPIPTTDVYDSALGGLAGAGIALATAIASSARTEVRFASREIRNVAEKASSEAVQEVSNELLWQVLSNKKALDSSIFLELFRRVVALSDALPERSDIAVAALGRHHLEAWARSLSSFASGGASLACREVRDEQMAH